SFTAATAGPFAAFAMGLLSGREVSARGSDPRSPQLPAVLTLPGSYPALGAAGAGPTKGERPGAGAPGRGHRPVRTPGRQISSVTCAGRPLSRVLRSPRAWRTATADGLGLGLKSSGAGPPGQIAPRLWSLARRPHSIVAT